MGSKTPQRYWLSIDAAPLKKGALTQGNASHTPLVVHHSDILSCSGLFYHICGTSSWVSLLATSFCFLFVFLFICCCSLFFLLPVSFLSSPFSLFVFFLLLSCFLSSLPSLFSFFLFFCTFFTLVFLRLFVIKSITYAVQHQLAFWHHRIAINSVMVTLHVIPTIHSLFKYPVSETERAQINWDLGRYDIVKIGELSMVPTKIFKHIFNTFNQLHVRPVVVLCGDKQQQQPIQTIEGRAQQTTGILNDADFCRNCIVVNFLEQHRCRDPLLQEYLNYLGYYKPCREFLRKLFRRRTLC